MQYAEINRQNNYPGGVTLEYTANKEKAPELPDLISVIAVSSGASSRQLLQSERSFGIYAAGRKSGGEQSAKSKERRCFCK
ncbi:MAG: hypothetical protein KAW19_04040 [Candidatus Aminicenantes bacterium]|nr:hypothetical protein [Candidatus Aminicenantes bacterium]